MNRMLLVVAATAAVTLGGCTSTASSDAGDLGPESPVPPATVSSSSSSSPPAEPTFEYTPPPTPVPPAPPLPEPHALPDPPEPVPQDECDPNYEGACVPVASDVDCAGGSGNGPEYVRGPVHVVGSDIYGLDRNKDGVGCE